jgi:hypothetical protein
MKRRKTISKQVLYFGKSSKVRQKKDGTKKIFFLLEKKVSYFEKSGKDK